MKTAIGYVRISKADQSAHSLDGQEEMIRTYCERNGMQLHGIFRDEGQSAKNFDRANWKQLEAYVKAHHADIDELIVMKYDRFSRNLSDALVMIEKLEKSFDIRITSVMEPIHVHPASPFFFQLRTQMLMGAQVELMVLRDRTKFGLVQGRKAGHWTNRAPFGYVNNRNEKKKSVLQIEPAAAALVQEIYRLWLRGDSIAEIGRAVRKKGYTQRGNSAIERILKNPCYMGKIPVPAYYDEPAQMVDALHEALITEADFTRAQTRFTRHNVLTQINDEVPLRGVLLCSCGHLLTAGESKGRGGKYWYYKCNKHPKANHSARRLHDQFAQLLDELSLPANVLAAYQSQLAAAVEKRIKERARGAETIGKEVAAVEAKIYSMESKFLADLIDADTYKRWKGELERERSALVELLADARLPAERFRKVFEKELPKLSGLHHLYKGSSTAEKQAFVRIVFDSSLTYSDGTYRTQYLMPLFVPQALILKEKGLLLIEQPLSISGQDPTSSETGI